MSTTVKTEQSGVVVFDASKVVMKKRLVVPTISLKNMVEGDTFYFKADGEIRLVTQIDEKTGEIKTEKNAKGEEVQVLLPILEVFNLQDGARGQIVLGAIVYRAFVEQDELFGRSFAMQKGRSLGKGKANLWELVEIE